MAFGVFGTEVLAIEQTLPVVLPDDGLEWTVAVVAQLIFDEFDELSDNRDVFVVCTLLIVDANDVSVDCES